MTGTTGTTGDDGYDGDKEAAFKSSLGFWLS
jgi:hypothetical protein